MYRIVFSLAIVASLAVPADAQSRRVYAGEEAKALKCAWIIANTATLLEKLALISTRDKEVSYAISTRMLQIYVSGTERQKLAALKAVGDRRDLQTTVKEFQTQAKACIRRFPPR